MPNIVRENSRKFILIAVMILCLVGIWKFNIYQMWFYLVPSENLGSPPQIAVKLIYLNPIYDYAINSYRTYVFVQTENNEIYRCCSWHDTKDWVKQSNYKTKTSPEERICAEEISKKWGLTKRYDNFIDRLSMGRGCEDSVLPLYSSYQITQTGTIKGKTIFESFFTELFNVIHLLCIRPTFSMVCIWSIYQIFMKKNPNERNQEKE